MVEDNSAALQRIRENIGRYGHHVYLVQQLSLPRFIYTIGLSKECENELLFAGGCFYMAEEAVAITNRAAACLRLESTSRTFKVENLGNFQMRSVHQTWSSILMLGALDYLKCDKVNALQIVPDSMHSTLDVPNCSEPWSGSSEPVWRWTHKAWDFPVPFESTAVTDLDLLRGARAVEAARWEEDQWEIFSSRGDTIDKENVRVVPLATVLGIDSSLIDVTQLSVGDGLVRRPDEDWRVW